MEGKVSFPIVRIPAERIFVVTGANTGIGYEVAKWIAMMGGTVILACRSEARAMEAIRKMNREYNELKQKQDWKTRLVGVEELRLEYMQLDLSSFKSTKDFVEAFKSSGRQLHVLVCNAGVSKAKYEKTEDGFESAFQINYLGHFLLIGQLLPVMMKTEGEDKRIIFVTSDFHKWPKYNTSQMNYTGDPTKYSNFDCYGRTKLYQINYLGHFLLIGQLLPVMMKTEGEDKRIIFVTSDFHKWPKYNTSQMNYTGDPTKYSNFDCYGRTKLYQVMHMYCLHRRLTKTNISVTCVHPGLIQTNIGRELVGKRTQGLLGGILSSPIEGANTIIYAASNPELKGVSGKYFKDLKEGPTSTTAREEKNQDEMWKQTMHFLKGQFTESEILGLEGAGTVDSE